MRSGDEKKRRARTTDLAALSERFPADQTGSRAHLVSVPVGNHLFNPEGAKFAASTKEASVYGFSALVYIAFGLSGAPEKNVA